MSDEHTIRLRGPWQLLIADEPVESVRIDSADLSRLCGHTVGEWALERRFRRPTNLGAAQVSLAVHVNSRSVTVALNEIRLGDTTPGQESRFPLPSSETLLEQNLLRLTANAADIDSPGSPSTWKCEVALKIVDV